MLENEEIENAANTACLETLPEKSKKRYNETYAFFKEWCNAKQVKTLNEKALLAYFLQRSASLKSPNSLWCEYSMLKSTIVLNDNEDISKYAKLRAFLKRKNDGYKPKKSNVFTRQEMVRFLLDAPDDHYLLMKVLYLVQYFITCW